jgi:hypothetical protein
MFASKDQFFTRTSGYNITKSLRFRASASAYLSRQNGASDSNRKVWTLSFWMKPGQLSTVATPGDGPHLFMVANAAPTSNPTSYMRLLLTGSSNNLVLQSAGSAGEAFTSTNVFRDFSAWYHVVLYMDNANTVVKCYVNNSEITYTSRTNPSNTNGVVNAANNYNRFGIFYTADPRAWDGYLAEINFIDGQALTPSSFGAIDANGVWSPIQYTGTYGTYGYYLKFTDASAATAAAIGKDYSVNGNNFTPTNISVTSGVTYDSMIDSPTNAASGTQPVGNYCVISPLDENFTTSTAVVSDGNLKFALSSTPANQQVCRGTMAGVSKFYFEVVTLSVGAGLAFGVKTTGAQLTSSGGLQASASWEIICSNGNKWNGSSVAYGSAYTTNDVGMCAVDPVNGKIWFGKNGTWFASGDPAAGTNAAFTNVVSSVQPLFECGLSTDSIAANFGQRPFTYTPPSGYQALCTANLTTPTIKNGAQYMAATTYTGTGATQTIANTVNSANFQPDLVWIKSRSAATNHNLFDAIRGTTNYLISNSTAANASNANTLTAFGSTGFTLGSDASSIGVNVNTATYVGWQWLAGAGTTSSNANGSITSTVCVNTTSGFSVVTYTGTGANATVGHGLGVAPSMIIGKCRSAAGNAWIVGHSGLTAPAWNNLMILNTTAAINGAGNVVWNNTAPTSSVFSLGTDTNINTNGATNVAYCFASITGYSAFGSYTGNGSTDGPFVYCGFRPRFVLLKSSSAATDWYIYDTARDTYNLATLELNPNLAAAEQNNVYGSMDILSNGFKLRFATGEVNASGATYIYAAFAENPFNYSRAR